MLCTETTRDHAIARRRWSSRTSPEDAPQSKGWAAVGTWCTVGSPSAAGAGQLKAEAGQALALILDTPALFVVSARPREAPPPVERHDRGVRQLDPLSIDVAAANAEHEAAIGAGGLRTRCSVAP